MIAETEKSYSDGARVARSTIKKGVPRWVTTSTEDQETMIDHKSGLPIITMTAPVELKIQNEAFARGHIEEILSAISSGKVTVDFRPLLMTRTEVLEALDTSTIGLLDPHDPHLESPNHEFYLEIRTPKSKRRGGPLTWVAYRHQSYGEWPEFELFNEPLQIATAKGGKVLVFKTRGSAYTRDVKTTQILNRYQLARPW